VEQRSLSTDSTTPENDILSELAFQHCGAHVCRRNLRRIEGVYTAFDELRNEWGNCPAAMKKHLDVRAQRMNQVAYLRQVWFEKLCPAKARMSPLSAKGKMSILRGYDLTSPDSQGKARNGGTRGESNEGVQRTRWLLMREPLGYEQLDVAALRLTSVAQEFPSRFIYLSSEKLAA